RRAEQKSLVPMRRIDQHEPSDLVGVLTGEILHVETSERVADQHVRRLDAATAQLAAKLRDDRFGVACVARRVAAFVARAVIAQGLGAIVGNRALNLLPDFERVAEAVLEDDRGMSFAFDVY